MNKQELFRRIKEGSPVCVGIPVPELNRIIYVSLDKKEFLNEFRNIPDDTNILGASVVGENDPTTDTTGFTVWIDLS